MENFYYGLRISIQNILSSVSEETVNDIIHAIQKAGFKSLSHLQFVQEEHLMFILKPIPRRKLIKAWRKPGMIEEIYERRKNEDASWQIDEFLVQARNSFESSTSPVLMESITDLLKTNICRILNSVSEETLNNIIHALKYAGLELLLDLQFVREEDLPQVLDPIQRRQLVKAWSQQVTISSELSSVSLPRFYWTWKKCFVLLRLYTRYKSELSSSNINEWNLWRKLLKKLEKNNPGCDAKMCRNQIHDMKCEYERMKHKKPYELRQPEAVFLDEAENAFENTENPVFSVQANLEKWCMSKPDRVKLLEVYEKYKEEVLLQNFDVEKQIVWGKVAREVSEKCSSYYGKRQCCCEIHNLKNSYEVSKRRNEMRKKKKKICKAPYFFEAARKTFESTECTDQHDEVNSLKDFTVKQETKREDGERRDWYKHIDIL